MVVVVVVVVAVVVVKLVNIHFPAAFEDTTVTVENV